jgi:hypothetical protein
MRDASERSDRELSRCQCCSRDTVIAVKGLFRNPKTGSPRRFCSPACRQAAYRRRKVGIAETAPAQLKGGRGRRLRADEEVMPLAE